MTSSYTSTATLPISSLESDKNICEAFDCDNPATTQVEVQAGKYGTMTLNLCIDCVPLFINKTNPEFNRKIDDHNHPEGGPSTDSNQLTEIKDYDSNIATAR